jgi:spermidine synthase
MLLVFALTLFGSATLLFMVEPMVGKMMLPLLGGTPAVWNTCMVFYQAVLLAGYAYAHATTAWLGARKQVLLHLAVLVVPFAFFLVNGPLAVPREIIADHAESPILALLLVLTVTVGMPLFVVSTTAPLLQHWFANTDHPSAGDPYFLYGASNLGSMVALLGYPSVVEPHLKLAGQRFDWAVGYGALVVAIAACAAFLWLSPPASAAAPEKEKEAPVAPPSQAITKDNPGSVTAKRGKGRNGRKVKEAPAPVAPEVSSLRAEVTWARRLRWIALAVVPSSLMLGATTYITTDIAAIPLLWVLPLALYLLSFIIVFSKMSLPAQRVAVWVLPVLFVVGGTVAAAVVLSDPANRSPDNWLGWAGVVVGGGAVGLFGAYLSLRASNPSGPLQPYVVWLLTIGLLLALVFLAAPAVTDNPTVLWLVRAGAVVGVWFSLKLFQTRDPELLHSAMVLALPLLVLLLTFLMLSELKARIGYTVGMHLVVLFVVAMVCHGELARDRPDPKHLTEYFLWMSVGGVIGGLFNSLVAPLAFNSLAEYPLAMMAACLLLPMAPRPEGGSAWARRADWGMAALFVVVGVFLLLLRRRDNDVNFQALATPSWLWAPVAVLAVAAVMVSRALRARGKGEDRWLDLALPLSLGVLVAGLYFGLPSDALWPHVKALAAKLHMRTGHLTPILTYGLPAVLCYTFVERPLRFGLGLGAILLASGACATADEGPLFQKRSFFGVMKVEQGVERAEGREFRFHRLVHGTTVHGKQFIDDEEDRRVPISYYYETGPLGHFCVAYNTDARRNMAVIGLGTGTMAAWARPGQRLTFYDIDPVVRDISYTRSDFFSFVKDAKDAGVKVDLVLGDARLTMERQQLSEAEKYGILVVDAFSSDAIPIHLLTQEALRMYLTKMTEDGLIIFHISNRYLRLEPVLANLVEADGLAGIIENDNKEEEPGKSTSTWVVVARKPEYLARLLPPDGWAKEKQRCGEALLAACAWPAGGTALTGQAMLTAGALHVAEPPPWRELKPEPKVGVWTDDYSNLLSVFDW